jgi:hypothetical protein
LPTIAVSLWSTWEEAHEKKIFFARNADFRQTVGLGPGMRTCSSSRVIMTCGLLLASREKRWDGFSTGNGGLTYWSRRHIVS